MKLLSIDTSSTTASVAVVEGTSLLSEVTVARIETHSRQLMNMITTSLNLSGHSIHEIDGFAYTRGPGSFTGLRIGLSVIKGLAYSLGKPLIGVSSLEVMAYQTLDDTRLICPMMDARNNEVYFARYRLQHGELQQTAEEKAVCPEEAVAGIDSPCILTGEGSERYRPLFEERLGKLARFTRPVDAIPRASTTAHLALSRFQQQHEDIRKVVPVYLRKAFAESSPFIDRTP